MHFRTDYPILSQQQFIDVACLIESIQFGLVVISVRDEPPQDVEGVVFGKDHLSLDIADL
jgi:hypothetical protein